MNIERLKQKEIISKHIINIGGTEEVADIPGVSEQQFLLVVKPKLPPGSKITYEPEKFEIIFKEGDSVSTAPDWKIEKPCGEIRSVEITLEENLAEDGGKDPKEKQRWIMSHFPERHYAVLYGKNLKKIEKKHPRISFRHSKRIRR